jgi:hypothetical protein
LLKQVKILEAKKQGIDMQPVFRDPVIAPGMPGSSCQMHTQITDEIMKNLQRRSPIEVSEST